METMTTIPPVEMKRRLDAGEVRFMFDLRNADEFAAWRIEGRSDIETMNIPQTDFVGEEEKFLGRFPKEKQITVVCAHGDSSKYSAELLKGRGFDAVSLEGGMDAWSDFYEKNRVNDSPAIYQVYRVAKGCISYLVASEGEAVIIDATRHIYHVLNAADSLGVKITHVFDTHLQADHISGGREIARGKGAVYHLHPDDATDAAYDYVSLKDGQKISFGRSSLEVIHSPGHTPGSTSFLLDNRFLFTGDTIMKTSIGRPDLGGKADEWALLLHQTLFERYEKLDDSTIIFPTHAASIKEQDSNGVISTTLGAARSGLDLYRMRELEPFVGLIKSSLLENPGRYQDIRKVNLGLLDPDDNKRKELEIGKNLCGMAGK